MKTATWMEISGPLLPSRWASAGRLAFLAGMLGTAAITLPAIAILFGFLGEHCGMVHLIFLGTTQLYTALVLRTVMKRTRRPETSSAVGWTVLYATLGGAANAATLLLVLFGAAIVFLPHAIGIGAGFGFVFGLVLAPLLDGWHRAIRVPHHAAADEVAVWAGIWLILVGAMGLMIGVQQHACAFVLEIIALTGVTGAILAVLGRLRIVRRRCWLARVVRDEDPTWRVAPRPETDVAASPCGEGALIPLVRDRRVGSYDGVLVRRQDGVSGPYRSCGDGAGIALVRLHPSDDEAPAAPHPALLGLAAAGAVGMAFVGGLATARMVPVRHTDVGVIGFDAGLQRLFAGCITFAVLGIALLAVVWHLGRHRSLVWAIGAPLMGAGLLLMELGFRSSAFGF